MPVLNKHTVLNSSLLVIVFISFSIFSTAKGTEELAKKLFKEGKYSEALPYYKELNILYTDDELFQYYYGVCLTQTGVYGQKTRKLLLSASQGKVVPVNVFFYIGNNYHAQNNFELAKTYYQRFAEYARKNELKAVNYDEILDQCDAGVNPFEIKNEHVSDKILALKETDSIIVLSPNNSSQSIDSVYSVNSVHSIDSFPPSEQTKITDIGLKIPNELADTTFNFTLTSTIRYQIIDQFKTTKGKTSFIEGWKSANQLEQLLQKLDFLRNEYENTSDDEKQLLAQKILDMEMETLQLKTDIDKHNNEALKAEMDYWKNATNTEIRKLKTLNDSIDNRFTLEQTQKTPIEQETTTNAIKELSDTTSSQPASVKVEEQNNKVIYKVQIGSFSKGLPDYIDRLYKKLAVLRKIDHYTDDRGITVYTIGRLTDANDALKLQNQIRQEGVKDAFVVAYYNEKRITLKEAQEITK